jgi:hypothetical protein
MSTTIHGGYFPVPPRRPPRRRQRRRWNGCNTRIACQREGTRPRPDTRRENASCANDKEQLLRSCADKRRGIGPAKVAPCDLGLAFPTGDILIEKCQEYGDDAFYLLNDLARACVIGRDSSALDPASANAQVRSTLRERRSIGPRDKQLAAFVRHAAVDHPESTSPTSTTTTSTTSLAQLMWHSTMQKSGDFSQWLEKRTV